MVGKKPILIFWPFMALFFNCGFEIKLNPESRKELIQYLKDVEYKYTNKGLRENKKDHLAAYTAPTYVELVKLLGCGEQGQ